MGTNKPENKGGIDTSGNNTASLGLEDMMKASKDLHKTHKESNKDIKRNTNALGNLPNPPAHRVTSAPPGNVTPPTIGNNPNPLHNPGHGNAPAPDHGNASASGHGNAPAPGHGNAPAPGHGNVPGHGNDDGKGGKKPLPVFDKIDENEPSAAKEFKGDVFRSLKNFGNWVTYTCTRGNARTFLYTPVTARKVKFKAKQGIEKLIKKDLERYQVAISSVARDVQLVSFDDQMKKETDFKKGRLTMCCHDNIVTQKLLRQHYFNQIQTRSESKDDVIVKMRKSLMALAPEGIKPEQNYPVYIDWNGEKSDLLRIIVVIWFNKNPDSEQFDRGYIKEQVKASLTSLGIIFSDAMLNDMTNRVCMQHIHQAEQDEKMKAAQNKMKDSTESLSKKREDEAKKSSEDEKKSQPLTVAEEEELNHLLIKGADEDKLNAKMQERANDLWEREQHQQNMKKGDNELNVDLKKQDSEAYEKAHNAFKKSRSIENMRLAEI